MESTSLLHKSKSSVFRVSQTERSSTREEDEPWIDLKCCDNTLYETTTASLSPDSFLYKVKRFFNDKIDKHPLEQAFVYKLDMFLMTSSMLGYFIKNLNQSNISIAYNNGMEEYFYMDKNQYNYLLSIWTVGYIIGQIPANYVIHHNLINFRYFLGFLQICWSFIAILQYNSSSLNQLYILRFILALLEAPLFISLEYLLGSWYSPTELNKRSTYLAISSGLASIIAGPLQQVIIEFSKDSNVPPFKLNFIMDAVVSFPIAIFTIIANPNIPTNTNNWYWNETDKLVALERRRLLGAQTTKKKTSKGFKSYKRYLGKWQVWVFPLIFWGFNNSGHASSQPTLVSWMKIDLQLSSEYFNLIPSVIHALGIIAAVTVGYTNDYLGGKHNHVFIKIFFVSMIVGCLLLTYWDLPIWLHWIAYCLISIPGSWGQPQIFSWVNRILVKDDSMRSFVISVTNTFAYVIGCWVPIFVWNTGDKPRYFIGFVYTACLSTFGLIMTYVGDRLTKRDEYRERTRGIVEVELQH
ncbi:major facilitator superfamily domain-containing protein [Scheffersomyces xylosifermentans]|uniref:major facilitator superfamily domain-containing protein n=1 Tax=Scheffersomyces xylosifermentans TaxID=1304137 RepID=UPI00315D43E7